LSLFWLVFLTKRIYSAKTSTFFLVLLGLLSISLVVEFAFAKRPDYSFTKSENDLGMVRYSDQVKREIRDFRPGNRKILNLVCSQFIFEFQQDAVMNDLYPYKILWNSGVLSVKPMLNKIKERYSDLIVLREDQYPNREVERPSDSLIQSVFVYCRLNKVGRYFYFTPRPTS